MKRILFIGLSFLLAIGCADNKPAATVDNTADDPSAVTSDSSENEQSGDDSSSQTAEPETDVADDQTTDVQESTSVDVEVADDSTTDEIDVEPEVEVSLADQYRKLVSDFRTQMFKLQREQQTATPEEQQKIAETVATLQPKLAKDVQQIFAGKEDDDAYVEAVPLLIMSLPDEEVEAALGKIAEHHLENDKWFEACAIMGMQNFNHPQFINFVEKQVNEGSGKSQAAARFVLASSLNAETDEARIVELLTSVMEYEGELMIQGRFDLKAQADDKIFTLTKLAIGKEAPEIEGEDAEGVTFKLSDYRGKVVMLDFWGNW